MKRQLCACLGILAVLVLPCIAGAGTFKTIVIDDAYGDWAGVPVLDSDPAGDDGGGPDIGDTQIANDNENLYIRNTFHNSIALSTYTSMDVDENTATGYDIFGLGLVGSEASWQNDFAFEQGTGVWNAGGLSGDYFGGGHGLLSPFADAANREMAISLSALFGTSGTTIFPDDTFTLLFWTNEGDVSSVITYTLAVPEPAAAVLALVCGSVVLGLRRRR